MLALSRPCGPRKSSPSIVMLFFQKLQNWDLSIPIWGRITLRMTLWKSNFDWKYIESESSKNHWSWGMVHNMVTPCLIIQPSGQWRHWKPILQSWTPPSTALPKWWRRGNVMNSTQRGRLQLGGCQFLWINVFLIWCLVQRFACMHAVSAYPRLNICWHLHY